MMMIMMMMIDDHRCTSSCECQHVTRRGVNSEDSTADGEAAELVRTPWAPQGPPRTAYSLTSGLPLWPLLGLVHWLGSQIVSCLSSL